VENLTVHPQVALDCALIANELITNSVKHGFMGGRQGIVRVGLARQGTDELVLWVADNGVGINQDIGDSRQCGRGLRWVHSLVKVQYHGMLARHDHNSVQVTMRVPGGIYDHAR